MMFETCVKEIRGIKDFPACVMFSFLDLGSRQGRCGSMLLVELNAWILSDN